MLKRKTVFVLGAGASNEFDLPLGGELVPAIERAIDIRYDMGTRLVSGDSQVAHALMKRFIGPDGNVNPYNDLLHVCQKLKRGLAQGPTSIDMYLDAHSQDTNMVFVGKVAIARLILAAESKSTLRIAGDDDINIDLIKSTWLPKLRELLFSGQKKERAQECLKNATFISFNYDRCLEHFLYYSFRRYFQLEPTVAAECMQTLKLFFPYGSVGSLPWQHWKASDELKLEFGANATEAELLTSSSRIRLFTEGVKDAVLMSEMRQALEEAQQIVFLGFGFHQQNMELLSVKQRTNSVVVFGTASGQSNYNLAAIVNSITSALAGGAHVESQLLQNSKCSKLMDDLSLVLRSA